MGAQANVSPEEKLLNFKIDRSGNIAIKQARENFSKEVSSFLEVTQQWREDSKVLNNITEVLSDAFIRLTHDGYIIEFNAAACHLFDTTESFILGKHITTILVDSWTSLVNSNSQYVEHSIKTVSGRVLNTSTSVTRSGDQYILLMRDVTEQVKKDSDIRALSYALDAASDVVIITNKTNKIIFVNKAFTAHTGYTKEEAIGQDPGFYKSDLTPKETYNAIWENLRKKKVWEGTVFNIRKSGEVVEDYLCITPIMNGDPNVPAYYIAVKRYASNMCST